MELKNKIIEMKNALEGINSRINEAEELTANWKRLAEITTMEQNKEKRMKTFLIDFWNNIRYTKICIMGSLLGGERERESETEKA